MVSLLPSSGFLSAMSVLNDYLYDIAHSKCENDLAGSIQEGSRLRNIRAFAQKGASSYEMVYKVEFLDIHPILIPILEKRRKRDFTIMMVAFSSSYTSITYSWGVSSTDKAQRMYEISQNVDIFNPNELITEEDLLQQARLGQYKYELRRDSFNQQYIPQFDKIAKHWEYRGLKAIATATSISIRWPRKMDG